MVGQEPGFANLLSPSIQDCKTLRVFTHQQALEYLGWAPTPSAFQPAQHTVKLPTVLVVQVHGTHTARLCADRPRRVQGENGEADVSSPHAIQSGRGS
jgi:hypothetical protein